MRRVPSVAMVLGGAHLHAGNRMAASVQPLGQLLAVLNVMLFLIVALLLRFFEKGILKLNFGEAHLKCTRALM
jgi:hypothetical protein